MSGALAAGQRGGARPQGCGTAAASTASTQPACLTGRTRATTLASFPPRKSSPWTCLTCWPPSLSLVRHPCRTVTFISLYYICMPKRDRAWPQSSTPCWHVTGAQQNPAKGGQANSGNRAARAGTPGQWEPEQGMPARRESRRDRHPAARQVKLLPSSAAACKELRSPSMVLWRMVSHMHIMHLALFASAAALSQSGSGRRSGIA